MLAETREECLGPLADSARGRPEGLAGQTLGDRVIVRGRDHVPVRIPVALEVVEQGGSLHQLQQVPELAPALHAAFGLEGGDCPREGDRDVRTRDHPLNRVVSRADALRLAGLLPGGGQGGRSQDEPGLPRPLVGAQDQSPVLVLLDDLAEGGRLRVRDRAGLFDQTRDVPIALLDRHGLRELPGLDHLAQCARGLRGDVVLAS